MNQATQLYPGVYFETVLPEPSQVLPRMDIAAFVGFAEKGPLHMPVPIEDAARFRDIFGNDVALAWNRDYSRYESSYLGSSVEAFFKNGGRRCWVVRVADENQAYTHTFTIPGLKSIDGQTLLDAHTQARSAGDWADQYQVGSILEFTQLVPNVNIESGIVNIKDDEEGALEVKLEVTSLPAELFAGELVLVSFDDIEADLYLYIDKIEPQSRGYTLSGNTGYWYLTEDSFSPPIPEQITTEDAQYALYPIAQTNNLGFPTVWHFDKPTNSRPRIRLLRFELLAWRQGALEDRVPGLAFSRKHPRFWGNLPDDSVLFKINDGFPVENIHDVTTSLRETVARPRFPLAGSGENEHYLPIGMPSVPSIEYANTSNISGDDLGKSTSIRNGLDSFNSSLFLDDYLSLLNSSALMQEAIQRAYIRDEPTSLSGIYSLLMIDEVTMISVPDAIHRRWDRIPPEPEPKLDAPFLNDVKVSNTSDSYELSWNEISGVTSYILEKDTSTDFNNAKATVIRGNPLATVGEAIDLVPKPDTKLVLNIPAECPDTYYFRVRAERYGEVSPWSNNRAQRIPASSFEQCYFVHANLLELVLHCETISSPPDGQLFSWEFPDKSPSSLDCYELQIAYDAEFKSFDIEYSGRENQYLYVNQTEMTVYVRVRAWRGGQEGPWSNIKSVKPGPLSENTLQDVSLFSDNDLLGIHRAITRLCAARGDMLALLSAPRHYTAQELSEHVFRLNPNPKSSSNDIDKDDTSIPVPPLSTGEAHALDYVAFYHPWVYVAVENGASLQSNTRIILPDGPVAGSIARRSIEQGAWITPANDPFIDVVAVDFGFTTNEWHRLLSDQVNLIQQDTRGFMVMSAETLSQRDELKLINVRRLLNLLRRLAQREGNNFIFEVNSQAFRDRVNNHFTRFLSDMYRRGAFSGNTPQQAFRVVTGSSVNTIQQLDRGRLIIELRVAPAYPMRFLTIRLIQSGTNQIAVEEF